MNIGDTVRFKPGREGTFAPATELEIRAILGQFVVVEVGRSNWPILAERLEVVNG